MGVLGDFRPLNLIIHYRDPQKAHPCVNPRHLTHYCIIFFIGKIFLYVIATGKIRNSETPFCLNMHHFCKKCNRISVPYMGRYAAEESQLTACNANLRHLFSHSPR